jgi:hypothetical protein
MVGRLMPAGHPRPVPTDPGPRRRPRHLAAGEGPDIIAEALVARKEMEGCLVELVLSYGHFLP